MTFIFAAGAVGLVAAILFRCSIRPSGAVVLACAMHGWFVPCTVGLCRAWLAGESATLNERFFLAHMVARPLGCQWLRSASI